MSRENIGVLSVVFTDMSPYEFAHESPLHRTKDVVLTKEQLTLLRCCKGDEMIYMVIVEPRPHVDGLGEEEYHQYVTGDVTALIVNYNGIELGIPCTKRLVRLRLTPEQIKALGKQRTHSQYYGKPSAGRQRDVYETVSDAIITIKEGEGNEQHSGIDTERARQDTR